ncbi:MAG TPA: hypothetical protein VIT65_06715 [Microlunatus sp.]
MISQPVAHDQPVRPRAIGGAHGFGVFAGAIMILVGTFHVLVIWALAVDRPEP